MYKSNVNLNNYKIFYEVAISGSITHASDKLFLTQSAISKSIKKLESDLNTNLFYRNSKGVKLTEKGEELLYYVEKAFNSLITAERTIVESESLDRGKISIGVPSQIGSFYIFQNVAKFHMKYPKIEITIISKSTKELLNLLERHEIDFIIDTSPILSNLDNIVIKPLKCVRNCFVVNSNSHIKYNRIHSLCDISKYPLVLPISGTNNRKELDIIFNKNNIVLDNVINIHTSEMIVGAIKKDLGIGYIIYDVVKDNIESGEFKVIDIKEDLPKITINLVYIKKYLTIAPKFFIENYLKIHI
ncbi:MAG: LysR family transcriptional regulator [Bacilli bacterium]|nr:LysR family transcriptional regulator [Bacilli bacterium]